MKLLKFRGDIKMRKFLIALLILTVLFSAFPANVFAAEQKDMSSEYIYYEDGSYLVITIQVTEARSTTSKMGTKTYQHYGSDGTVQWQAVLRGIFYYDGTTSNCTSSVCDVTIYNSEWYTASKNVKTSGNSALAYLTMERTRYGVVVDSKQINMSLSCDANGNLS